VPQTAAGIQANIAAAVFHRVFFEIVGLLKR
jgi:hypothetical protein